MQATSVVVRWLLRCFAFCCLILAIIGVVLPGMPTTVFVLMAAWAAARSSPKLLIWLYEHRIFGSVLYNWDHGRTVSRKAKYMAALMMAICAVFLFLSAPRVWMALLPCAVMACVLLWLWSRPEPTEPTDPTDAGGEYER